MKLKEYIEQLNQFIIDNPECLEMMVISSIDDEGNGYVEVNYGPDKGVYKGYDEWLPADYIGNEEYGGEDYTEEDINAVCIN